MRDMKYKRYMLHEELVILCFSYE